MVHKSFPTGPKVPVTMVGQVLGLTDFMLNHACSLLGLTFETFLDWDINWGP